MNSKIMNKEHFIIPALIILVVTLFWWAEIVSNVVYLVNVLNINYKTCNTNTTDHEGQCEDTKLSIAFDSILLCFGVINFFIWLVSYLVYLFKSNRWDTEMTYVKSGIRVLQARLEGKNYEITNLNIQLNKGRNDRRSSNYLPPQREQRNERGRLLTTNRSSDYKAVH